MTPDLTAPTPTSSLLTTAPCPSCDGRSTPGARDALSPHMFDAPARWTPCVHDAAARLAGSPIRQLALAEGRDDVVYLAGGLPATDLLPARSLADAAGRVLSAGDGLLYGDSAGDPRLLHELAILLQRFINKGVLMGAVKG